MRALLVLYMVLVLKFGDAYGSGIYADYYGLIELGGVLGFLVSDKLLGMRRALIIGAFLLGVGNLLLAMNYFQLVAFAFIVIGSSLFAPNLIAQLASYFFQKTISKQRKSFLSSMFLIMSAGGYIAAPLYKFFSDNQFWWYGFSLASIGTIAAGVWLTFFSSTVDIQEEKRTAFKQQTPLLFSLLLSAIVLIAIGVNRQTISLQLLPWLELLAFALLAWILLRAGLLCSKQVIALSLYLVSITLFYAFEEYLTNYTLACGANSSSNGISSHALVNTLNPVIVLCLEGPLDMICRRLGNPFLKLSIPFFVAALSFAILLIGNSVGFATGGVSFISMGEVVMGSIVYWGCLEFASEVTDSRLQGKLFCLVAIIFPLATYFGSRICRELSNALHGSLGVVIFLLLIIGCAFGFILQKSLIQKLKQSV